MNRTAAVPVHVRAPVYSGDESAAEHEDLRPIQVVRSRAFAPEDEIVVEGDVIVEFAPLEHTEPDPVAFGA